MKDNAILKTVRLAAGRLYPNRMNSREPDAGRIRNSAPMGRVISFRTGSYCKNCCTRCAFRNVAGAGIEPATRGFSVRCSTN